MSKKKNTCKDCNTLNRVCFHDRCWQTFFNSFFDSQFSDLREYWGEGLYQKRKSNMIKYWSNSSLGFLDALEQSVR